MWALELSKTGIKIREESNMRLIAAVITALFLITCSAASAMAGDVSGALVEVLKQKGVLDEASYNEIQKARSEGGEQAVNKKLIEVLHAKGVIDDTSYNQLSAQAASEKPSGPPAAPQASAALEKPADRPADKTLTSIEEGIARLGGDTVKLKIGTWTQLGFVNDAGGSTADKGSNSGALPGSSAGVRTADNMFYIRFARIYFNGTLSEKVGFRVMLDAAGTPSLRDAYLWDDHIPYTRVTLGQFLTQFGDETWRAPFDLPMINYSFPAQFMQFANFRDIGIMVNPKYTTKVGDMPLGFNLYVAAINGSGMNVNDGNGHKDIIGRMTINPLVKGLSIGGSWYAGQTNELDAAHGWDRWAAEFDYAPEMVKGLALRGEYLAQRKFYTTGALNRYVHSNGYYMQGLYRLNGFSDRMSFLNDFEGAARYDRLKEDEAVTSNSRERYTFGINYWLNKYTRMLADYEIIHAQTGLGAFSLLQPGSGVAIDIKNHQVFTLNAQIWF